jgi:hypothetical protein
MGNLLKSFKFATIFYYFSSGFNHNIILFERKWLKRFYMLMMKQ